MLQGRALCYKGGAKKHQGRIKCEDCKCRSFNQGILFTPHPSTLHLDCPLAGKDEDLKVGLVWYTWYSFLEWGCALDFRSVYFGMSLVKESTNLTRWNLARW